MISKPTSGGGLRSLVGEFSDASFDSLLRALLIGGRDGKAFR